MGLDTSDELSKEHGEPLGDLPEILLSKGEPRRIVWIGSDLDKVIKERLIAFLLESVDVFAWFVADIFGIDSDVMVHRLNIGQTYRSVKQKQSFVLER